MKRLPVILLAGCILLALFYWAAVMAVKLAVRRQLEQVFVQSRVQVSGCWLAPGPGIGISGISIKRPGYYELATGQAILRYPGKVILNDPVISLVAPARKMQDYAGCLRISPGSPGLVKQLQVTGLRLEAKTLDCVIRASLSLRTDLAGQAPGFIQGRIDTFSFLGLEIKEASLGNEFSISRISYDKFKITQVKGALRFSPQECALSGVAASMLGGKVAADIKAGFIDGVRYAALLSCAGLDIEQLVSDFKLKEKFTMTGKLSGNLDIRGTPAGIEFLGGKFFALDPGGVLVITDMKFIEGMASGTGQPVDLLVESFKNYRYNTGKMTAGIQGESVILEAALEGEAGKRNLQVVFHGLPIRRQEK